MSLVKSTIYVSIIVQILTLMFGIYAYVNDVNPQNHTLDDIMMIENVVQGVEFLFYFTIAFIITNIPNKHLASYRYIDWSITTPLMLLTTLLYFVFIKEKTEQRENKEKKYSSVKNIIHSNRNNIIKLVLSNAGMLFLGYMQEIGKLPLYITNTVGFGFLFYSFYILYQYVTVPITQYLFWTMFVIWSLYGVAAMWSPIVKNTAYNILDVISKNFYGVFLAYQIMA